MDDPEQDESESPRIGGPVSNASVISVGPPPSYEQALGHRTIEYTPYDLQHGGSYPGPPALPGGFGSSETRRARRRGGTDEDGVIMGMDLKTGDWCVQLSLPAMHICMALTCLIFNLLLPGTGTMLSGFGALCCVRRDEWTARRQVASCWLCLGLGLTQLLLTPVVLMGWVWSVLWGFALVGRSQENYHAQIRRETNHFDVHTEVISPPPPYQAGAEPSRGPQNSTTTNHQTAAVITPSNSHGNASQTEMASSTHRDNTRSDNARMFSPGVGGSLTDVDV